MLPPYSLRSQGDYWSQFEKYDIVENRNIFIAKTQNNLLVNWFLSSVLFPGSHPSQVIISFIRKCFKRRWQTGNDNWTKFDASWRDIWKSDVSWLPRKQNSFKKTSFLSRTFWIRKYKVQNLRVWGAPNYIIK